jgi:cytochrome c oxidase cbb3-type subunit 4
MFKFIKQYAETINGVDIYPMISLFIFFSFFIVLLVLVKKMGKERVEALSKLPLENEELTNSTL